MTFDDDNDINRFLGHQLALWHLAWVCLVEKGSLDQEVIELLLLQVKAVQVIEF